VIALPKKIEAPDNAAKQLPDLYVAHFPCQ
jgi:hypothetical protein